jgi:hypothetical protein
MIERDLTKKKCLTLQSVRACEVNHANVFWCSAADVGS